MFVRLGQEYVASLLVTNINGDRILNDVPSVTIKDLQNNKFYNGISWQVGQCSIILNHIADGVYSYGFTLDTIGVYSVACRSDAYNISSTVTLEIFDEVVAKYSWLINTSFMIKYVDSVGQLVNFKIVKDKDSTYWDGFQWTHGYTVLTMPYLSGGVYSYSFIPDEVSEYSITVYTETSEVFYIINATSDAIDVAPIIVSHSTLISPNGSDSLVKNESNNPLTGVKVTLYDAITKEMIATTVTNYLGEWNIVVRPGKYYFMFEKAGYSSVGMERTVS